MIVRESKYRAFIDQVKQYLIDTDNEDLDNYKAYEIFKPACKQLGIADEPPFFKEIYKLANREINCLYGRVKQYNEI